jgi:2-phosphoglycolate phosphatase
MQKRLLIFDLDGTLVDSAQDIVMTMNKLVTLKGEKPIPESFVRSQIGVGLLSLVQGLFPHRNDWEDLAKEFRRLYVSEGLSNTKLYPDVLEFLQSWRHELAIVTNKSEGPTHHVLKAVGLDQIPWKSVIGGDTLKEKKPHPLPLIETMKRLKANVSETLMIGDAWPDLEAAEAAGVESVAVTFGYSTLAQLKSYKPIAFLRSYKDLGELIARLNQRLKVDIS